MQNPEEKERRKRAIFDAMGKRGQKWVMRLGWENWDPFQEPKDPRERVRSTAAAKARAAVKEYGETRKEADELRRHYHEVFELCRGAFNNDPRALLIVDFCAWFRKNYPDAGA
jgi:hypothetical protein